MVQLIKQKLSLGDIHVIHKLLMMFQLREEGEIKSTTG